MEEQYNTSGLGETAIVPDEIKRWNWGAFLMPGIWSIGNREWIGLIGFIPIVQTVMAIVLGIKGSEWAWQHRRFESIKQFKKVQTIWAIWGAVLNVGGIILYIVLQS